MKYEKWHQNRRLFYLYKPNKLVFEIWNLVSVSVADLITLYESNLCKGLKFNISRDRKEKTMKG